MEDNRKNRQNEEVFSKRIKAGRKRTYFIDVKPTKSDDYFLTITESKRDFKQPNNFIKHKIFLYKEDFNKFLEALTETINYVKTELITDFDFDSFDGKDDFADFGNFDLEADADNNLDEGESGK